MTVYEIDRDLVRTWAEHGIPDDDSTRAHAVKVLGRLLDELEAMGRVVDEVLDGAVCEGCGGDLRLFDPDTPAPRPVETLDTGGRT